MARLYGGLAFVLYRFYSLCAVLDSIRVSIAFPKNNQGRDVIIDSPSTIDFDQLHELSLKVVHPSVID